MIFRVIKKIWTDLSSILSQITRLTDGQTDRQTEFSSLDRVSIPCSAVKITSSYSQNIIINAKANKYQ